MCGVWQVMKRLMNIPSEFWSRFVNTDAELDGDDDPAHQSQGYTDLSFIKTISFYVSISWISLLVYITHYVAAMPSLFISLSVYLYVCPNFNSKICSFCCMLTEVIVPKAAILSVESKISFGDAHVF